MLADDLSTPLDPRGREAAGRAGYIIHMTVMAVLGIVMMLAGILGWAVLSADKLGGEPHVLLALDQAPPAVAPGARADTSLAMRQSVQPDAGPRPGGMSRIEPGGAPVITILGGGEATGRDTPQPGGAVIRHADGTPPPDARQADGPLARVPDPALVETGRHGPLPRIGEDGRRPVEVYARPHRGDVSPGGDTPARIAIMVGGLGISASATAQAINSLPPAVSLAFAPYGRDLQTWVGKARQNGHEVLLQLPMEPFDYPDNDPGPHTLLSDNGRNENIRRLHWLMARITGYFGVTNYMGARFTSDPQALDPVLREIAARGLGYVDDGTSQRSVTGQAAASHGLSAANADMVIDLGQTGASIDAALARLEIIAQERGLALASATAFPVTVERIAAWARTLQARGITLVPVSAALQRPPQT